MTVQSQNYGGCWLYSVTKLWRVLVVRWLAHVPFTSVTRVRFLLSAVIRLKFHLGCMCGSASSLTLSNTAGFLRVLQFPPVQTLDQ